MKNVVILGAGFGDEGKGMFTDYICKQLPKPIVIRFSGGHQAGHTVVREDNLRHVFSSFGSGTLRNVPTYWSKYCTFYPIAWMNEHKILVEKGINPEFYINPLAPLTTYLDVYFNRKDFKYINNGTCGVGVGQTFQRQEDNYKLYVQDLIYPDILKNKLELIRKNYYKIGIIIEQNNLFWEAIEYCKKFIKFKYDDFLNDYDKVFEGSQGILLDQDFGYFPHVTRSNTTSKNVFKILKNTNCVAYGLDIYYMTRWYQTRHGEGPMDKETIISELILNPNETNIYNDYQKEFRIGKLDVNSLKYAIHSDRNFNQRHNPKKHLVITCMDQIKKGSKNSIDFNLIKTNTGIDDILLSISEKGTIVNSNV